MNQSEEVKTWSYFSASKTICYVKPTLDEMRKSFILVWHYYKKMGYSRRGEFREQMKLSVKSGKKSLQLLQDKNIIAYQSPLRGIALFPFVVYCPDKNGSGITTREAYYVYKDSRPTIQSFIFADELIAYDDLYAWERPIPMEWMAENSRPTTNDKNSFS